MRNLYFVPAAALVVGSFFALASAQRGATVTAPPDSMTAKAVAAANAFVATLSDAERAKTLFPFDGPQKTNWSNLPSGIFQRNSLRLGDLTPAQRAALTLCFAMGFSHEEAAAALAMPLGTVKSHVNRGREKLAAMLGVWRTMAAS